MVTAHTVTYGAITNQMLVDCYISAPKTPKGQDGDEVKALWDTGAMVTCISETLAAKLALPVVGSMDITAANNVTVKTPVHCVQIRMGSFVVPCVDVAVLDMAGRGHDVIIGMDFMANGDTHISHHDGKTVLTFRQPSLEKCDFVEELELYNMCLKRHEINVLRKLPDKCACGSGKDYKNCHGKSAYNVDRKI